MISEKRKGIRGRGGRGGLPYQSELKG